MAAVGGLEKPGESSTSRMVLESSLSRIHAALAPRVAVLSADDVDTLLEPNRIESFAELLKPFQSSAEDVAVRTSQLETRQCNRFPFVFEMLDTFAPSNIASPSADAGVFTPADVVNGGTAEEDLIAKKSKRRTRKYPRPEVLLDSISARISGKSKALWEVRQEDGKVRSPKQSKNHHHHRRASSLYPRSAGLLLENEVADKEGLDVEELERYKSAAVEELMPWYADMRDMVYSASHISDHETFCHPVAIILVVSASSPDPMNALAGLFEASQANAHPAFHRRPYIDPLVFRYYVVLHDVNKDGEDLSESTKLLENVKKTYGLHCTLLPINSASASNERNNSDISRIWQNVLHDPSDAHARQSSRAKSIESWNGDENGNADQTMASLLSEEDIGRLKSFVREFAVQSLIPFMERCVSLWTEQVAASRRGLTGRLLGAGRKLFGGSRIGNQGSSASSYAQLGFYPHTSVEAQTRRLADFAFMTRDYKLAASMYDLGRKDYGADKAFKCLAGANEMFGLSHLMMSAERKGQAIVDVDSYLAAACQYYMLAPRQKGSALQIDGLRATLLYYDAYQGLQAYKMAPIALVRTANEGAGESENDLEVVAAMLLEQAALSDIRKEGGSALRKCALHLIMAAHRYRTCGQKYLSLRCFQASAHCYAQLRNASSVPTSQKKDGRHEESEDGERLADMIARSELVEIQHWDSIDDHMEYEIAQQALNDGRFSQAVVHYIGLLQRKRSQEKDEEHSRSLIELHEAYLQGLMTSARYLDGSLEEVLSAKGKQASMFVVDVGQTSIQSNASTQVDDEPWRAFESEVLGEAVSTSYKLRNTAAVGETFVVRTFLVNHLHIPVRLSDFTVSLEEQEGSDSNVEASAVHAERKQSITLEPGEGRCVELKVAVDVPCRLRCNAVQYNLEGHIRMRELLQKNGRRLNDTKEQRVSEVAQYEQDPSLLIEIHRSKAILEANFVEAPNSLGLGEERAVSVHLKNVGKAALRNLYVYLNRSDTLLAESGQMSSKGRIIEIDNFLERSQGIPIPLPGTNELAAGQDMTWKATVRGSAIGTLTLRALFTYKPDNGDETLTAQLQHVLYVEPVIDLNVQAVPSRTEDVGYDLRIDAMNILQSDTNDPQEGQVTIEKIDLIAPSWSTKDLLQPKHVLSNFMKMQRGQRYSTALHVQRVEDILTTEEERMDRFVQSLDGLVSAKSIDCVSQQSLKMCISAVADSQSPDEASVSPFLLAARREYRSAILAQEFPSLARREPNPIERIFPLYEPRELDVVAHWRIVGSSEGEPDRLGQAFVFGLGLGPLHDYLAPIFSAPQSSTLSNAQPTRTMYAETERERAAIWTDLRKSRLHVDEDPIMLDFVVPDKIRAEKLDGRQRFTFDLAIKLRNLSSLDAREVIIDLENTSSSTASSNNSTSDANLICASYVGRLTLRSTMKPFASITMTAKVSVPKAGTVTLPPVLVRSSKVDQQGVGGHRRREHCNKVLTVYTD